MTIGSGSIIFCMLIMNISNNFQQVYMILNNLGQKLEQAPQLYLLASRYKYKFIVLVGRGGGGVTKLVEFK